MTELTQNSLFIDDLKDSIEEVIKNDNIELGEQRIIVTIDSNGVKTKIVTPLPKKPRESRIPPEEARKIAEVKALLRGKRDLTYIFTLLISLSAELKKFDINILPEDGKKTLLLILEKTRDNLNSITKGVVEQ